MSDECNLPFVLRSPNGPHKGKYCVKADFQGVEWTDDIAKAKRLSVADAYGWVACAIDMCCTVLVPENVSGTEEDCENFGEIAANDMLQKPQPETVDLFKSLAARRSPEEPLFDMPDSYPAPTTSGYMSVWEWIGRAFYRGEVAAA